ncbi:unnamed protein product [Rhizophagus irregularis]|uniref:Uncharacterized protein n=1 Tax=Rhizophagus irregularis TaxID=588596 RepID=A0A2I1F9S0_9GLOM|nr:hypothetical protein RhiirB3_448526 [Rhizophagus irregularis]CAB4480430.1 unnamed protein product [Rhizophagus irregularis]CAB5332456.1 unnamed protein product [Rhizophagus irregularis]
MATQNCDKFDKIKNKDNRDFKLAIPLHENDPSYAKDISNDVSISFLDSAFNFFVELEKSAFKSVVYSHGKGLELKHPAGLMNFSVPNIQVIETAARRTRISESDKNNIASYKVSFTSPTNQLDSKSLLKYLEESKDGDQFDYSKFPFCKRPNLEDFTLDITNSNSNERITAQNYLLYQKPGFIPKIPCPKIISDEEIANLSEIEANIKKSEVIEKLNIHMFHCAKGSGVSKDVVEIERRRKLRFAIEFWRSYTKLEDFCYHNFPRQKGERSSSKAREVVEKFAENIREEFILREFNRIKAVAPHVISFMKEINYEWKIIDLFEELKYGFFETTLSNNNIRGIFLHLIKTGNVITLKDYQVIKESEKRLTRAQKRKQNNDGNKRTKQIKDK